MHNSNRTTKWENHLYSTNVYLIGKKQEHQTDFISSLENIAINNTYVIMRSTTEKKEVNNYLFLTTWICLDK
jgi:hypothetical protein